MRGKTIHKHLLTILGSLSLALGMIGLVLPILPTTPFLLLAAYCWLRSSKRLYDWLMGHKVFGPYLYHYMTHRAVMKRTKVAALILLWASLLVSMLAVDNRHVQILLPVVGLAVTAHVLSLKTLTQTELTEIGTRPAISKDEG